MGRFRALYRFLGISAIVGPSTTNLAVVTDGLWRLVDLRPR